MKILVVDDEALLVKGIRFNLQNEGYEVITGSDGLEAVQAVREQSPDLVVLDVMMPNMDGLTACTKIREFSDIPIIMLTAKTDDMDKLMGFEHGADDYLTKPFNILELKARIRALLRRAGSAEKKAGEHPDHRQHHPGLGRPERLPGRGAGRPDRQGIRCHRIFDAQPQPGLLPGGTAGHHLGL